MWPLVTTGSEERPGPAAYSSGNRFALREFVYVLRGDRASIQIGWTTSPSSRVSHIQTGQSAPVHYAFIAGVGGSAEAVEQGAHAILQAHKAKGEWFAVSPELGIAAVAVAAHRLGFELRPHDPEISERTIPAAPAEPAVVERRETSQRTRLIVIAAIGSLLSVGVAVSLLVVARGAGL